MKLLKYGMFLRVSQSSTHPAPFSRIYVTMPPMKPAGMKVLASTLMLARPENVYGARRQTACMIPPRLLCLPGKGALRVRVLVEAVFQSP